MAEKTFRPILTYADEAHRLFKRKNLGQAFKNFDTTCKELGFDSKTATQLDWIIKQGKYNVLFYDEDQSIRSTDIEYSQFQTTLKDSGKKLENKQLNTQMRCAGGDSFIKYIKNTIHCTQNTFEDIANYDFRIFDDANSMIEHIRDLDREMGLCRTVAGYAWEWKTKPKDKKAPKNDMDAYNAIVASGDYDISIQGHHYIWNLTTADWISRMDSPYTIGCIHTTQGFDLNYVGVIFGREIDYDKENNCLKVDLSCFYDSAVKNGCKEEEVKRYIINTYTTIMARGIKGCYVYAYNPNLQEYLKKYIREY